MNTPPASSNPAGSQTAAIGQTTARKNIHHLEAINSVQLHELVEANAVVILPISPLEEHGPHLPLGTDAIYAQHFTEMAADIIREKEPETPVVLAPLVPLGTHVYRFMGSIFIRQRVIRDLVIDYGRSLSAGGFNRFLIVSAHGGPKHMVALDEAATALTRRFAINTINLTSTVIYRFLAGKLTKPISDACNSPLSDEERQALAMDYHAGWWETAMMLWLRPELVAQSFRELPEALVPRWRLRPKTPLKPPAGRGYLGAPARADAEFARASLTVLRAEAAQIIEEFLRGPVRPSRFRSPLYWVPPFRTNFKYWVLAVILLLLVFVRLMT